MIVATPSDGWQTLRALIGAEAIPRPGSGMNFQRRSQWLFDGNDGNPATVRADRSRNTKAMFARRPIFRIGYDAEQFELVVVRQQ